MTVKEIVENWLKENGYDGLCTDDCGCLVGDLMPCTMQLGGCDQSDCHPGYKTDCPGPEECPLDGDCDWHVTTETPEAKK